MRILLVSILFATLVLAAGCGGNSISSSTSASSSGSSSGSNVLAIAVNGGPTANYPNGAFASATICAPGSTTNCVTVNGLLVDTGSTGLRVLQSALGSLSLPAVDASSGSAAYNCADFVDGAYLWGPVEQATVTLGGETAANLPIQVVSSSDTGIPSSCSNGGIDANTVANLGANGLLGVGSEPTDCFFEDIGDACSPGSGQSSPPSGLYYTCSGDSCSPAYISEADEVSNPAVFFSSDNNGVIVELPSVSGSAATVTGSLIFGIGTKSNNQLPSSATVFTLTCDLFTTEFENIDYGVNSGCAGYGSFIDSGSSALYFPDPGKVISTCPASTPAGNLSSWYCPTSTKSFSAINFGANGTSLATSFSVANAETLFTSTSTHAEYALGQLAGLNPTGYGFDWGLPFFYGNKVYVSIAGQKMPSDAPAAPWWAY